MAYTQVTAAGYNAAPPADDGSTSATNILSWSRIKVNLFDALKSGIETMNTNASNAVVAADLAVVALDASIATLSTNIDNLSSALGAPSGTVKLFRQNTPPTGWAKGTSYDDYALRLVTGTASTGGSTAFTSVFTARTIATANLPSHTHSYSDTADLNDNSGSFVYDIVDGNSSGSANGSSSRLTNMNNSNTTLSADYPAFSVTTGSAGSGSTWDFAVQYVDTIYATKS